MENIDALVPLFTPAYMALLAALLFSRSMDLLSTWLATPRLVLEANPIARRLGWRGGLLVNMLLCLALAAWPLPAIVLATTSVLVAARNFQSAWLMRLLGETGYRLWIAEKLRQSNFGFYLFCLLAQAALTGLVGAVVICYSRHDFIPLAIGFGIITYAVTVVFYTLLSASKARSLTS